MRIERSEISRDVLSGGLKSFDGGTPVSISYDFFLKGGWSGSIGTSGLSVAIRIGYRSWSGLPSAITCGLEALVGSKLEILLAMLIIRNKKQIIFIPKISSFVKSPACEAYSLGKVRGKEQLIHFAVEKVQVQVHSKQFILRAVQPRIYRELACI